MEQLLTKVADLAPVVAILIYFIWYFKGELKQKDADAKLKDAYFIAELKLKNDEIKDLNTVLRNINTESITAINRMSDVVEHLTEWIKQKG